jgi:hypothetical protein
MKKQEYEFQYAFDIETDENKVIRIMDRLSSLAPLTKELAEGFLGLELFRWGVKEGKLKPSKDGRYSIESLDALLGGGLFFHMTRDEAAETSRIPRKALDALSDSGEGPAFHVVNGIRYYRVSALAEFEKALPNGSVKHAVRIPFEFWEEFQVI